MSCADARRLLLAEQRGRLPSADATRLGAHLEGCAACRGEDAGERALAEALTRHLPRRAAPVSLKLRLEARVLSAPANDVRPAHALTPRAR